MLRAHAGPAPKVLVVGGGVAGLTAASALGQNGHEIDLVDIKGSAEGTGIGIQNRGPDVLQAIGALDAVIAGGAARERVPVKFYDAAGSLTVDPHWPAREDGLPAYILIFRPLLADILRSRAEQFGARIRIGITVQTLEQDESGVDVSFTDGSSARYDLVVGADGIRSQIRRTVFGDHIVPENSGSIGLRWVPKGLPHGKAGFYYGSRSEMVVIPMHDDMTYVSAQHVTDEHLDPAQARDVLRAKLDEYSAPYLRTLRDALTDDQEVLARRYEVVMVDAPWHRGRVVLIGDAAHATTAHLGSGGVMALEDAVVLAEELADASSVDSALTAFGRRRYDRCRLVVDTSLECSRLQAAGASGQEMGQVRGPALKLLSDPF